jgi:hypothetical protein
LEAAIAVLDRDTSARRFKTQLVDKERFTTEGRGGTTEDSNAKCKGDLVGLDGTSPKRAVINEGLIHYRSQTQGVTQFKVVTIKMK